MKKKNVKTSSSIAKFANNTITKKDAKRIKGGIVVDDITGI